MSSSNQVGPHLKAGKAYINLSVLAQKALFETPDTLEFVILLWNRLHISNADYMFFWHNQRGRIFKVLFMKAATSEGG